MVRIVVPHDPNWAAAFVAESCAIQDALGASTITLHHIGSTSIPGIYAKPIIDSLGEVADLAAIDQQSEAMQALGYEVMGAFGIEGRRYFCKLNRQGVRTHHLHVFTQGSDHVARHLAFRDYLRAHPKVAQQYSDLKRKLVVEAAENWDIYLDGKDPFIKATEAKAIIWWQALQS